MLKYAYENGCSFNKFTCSEAASEGYLEIVKWLHNNCPWDESTCSVASQNGYYENGCPWDMSTYLAAIKNGNSKILKYISEKDLLWDKETSMNIVRNAYNEMLASGK
jgi:hypothetical protein